MNKIYPFGYSPAAVGMMKSRTAEANAGFLIDHLSRGMSVLDIGCGPGSITLGIAKAVAPGEVTGIDIEPTQVALGRDQAKQLGLSNCKFETASVFDLPIPDEAIDAVFGHTILMQFNDINPVLSEVKRVLKPGGLVGFCEVDIGASLYHSEESVIRDVMLTLRRSIFHNEGNPDIGRALPALISSAGLQVLSTSARYSCSSTADAKRNMYKAMTNLWEQAEFPAQAVELGWLSESERESMPSRLELEASDPASFNGTTYVEVVARKPQ